MQANGPCPSAALVWLPGASSLRMFGWFVVEAGWSRDSSEVATTASLMRLIAAQPGGLGRWLLGITAAGFIAYGFYQLVHARYLRIRRVG